MQEHDNVLRIFKETEQALKKGDSATIKNLSNQTINTASLTQDADNIAVAVLVYSLSKIVESQDYQSLKGWDSFYRVFITSIESAIKDINDEKKIREDLEMIRKAMNKVSWKLKKYIQEVFRKASINKASKIYEHGLSMETTARLLGITMFELASYSGQTEVSDAPLTKTIDVKARIKIAEEMFG